VGNIVGWDFTDIALNFTTQQINRQKSGMNLEVLKLNHDTQEAFFFDPRNGEIKASLVSCECKDFSFSGNHPRKKFAPCMHIYRLAIELGLMQAKHYDKKTRLAIMSPEERKAEEVRRIQEIERDPGRWGYWGEKVHSASSQQDRQYRAYDIFLTNDFSLEQMDNTEVSGYYTTLESCTCPDFAERRIPCKHIYCLALAKGYELRVTFEDFRAEKERFESSFVPLIEISINSNTNDETKMLAQELSNSHVFTVHSQFDRKEKSDPVFRILNFLFHKAVNFAEKKRYHVALLLLQHAERLVLDNSDKQEFTALLPLELWNEFFPYALYRDLSDYAFWTGSFAEAAQYAEKVGRFDLAGDAHYAIGDFRASIAHYCESGVSKYRSRDRRLVDAIRHVIVAGNDTLAGLCKSFPNLQQLLVRSFGTLKSVEVRLSEDYVDKEIEKILSGIAGTDLEASLREAQEIISQAYGVADYRSLIESYIDLYYSGNALESLQLASRVKTECPDDSLRDYAYQHYLDLLLLTGKFHEVCAELRGRYQSSNVDYYLNALILSGQDLDENDILTNFYYHIKERSNLYERIPERFIEYIRDRLVDFRNAHNCGLLEFASKYSSQKDPFGWNHKVFIGFATPLDLPVNYDYYSFCEDAEFINMIREIIQDAEIAIRETLDLPKGGEKWVSEKEMYEIIRAHADGCILLRHASPKWLAPQHLDVFIPELKLAFEYMGEQHFMPVSLFGGSEGLQETKKRDERKVKLCTANGVRCAHIRFDEPWNLVRESIRLELTRRNG
jgi:hypothetical protein